MLLQFFSEVDQEFIMDTISARRFPKFELIETNYNLFDGKVSTVYLYKSG